MSKVSRFLTSRWGPVLTGVVIGVVAPLLVKLGNPGNMGFGMVCFVRDIAGALGLHQLFQAQYLRPEIMGGLLGAFLAAIIFKEFKPRTGSSPLVRFFLGILAAFGALIFAGCPWRAYLRLSGGDFNAIYGILGLILGIWIGTLFIKRGFSLGRSYPAPRALGLAMPAFMVVLLLLLVLAPGFGRDECGSPVGPVFFSAVGPGSEHAPLVISLAAGLLVGFLAQRSRFCTISPIRNSILVRDPTLLYGIIALTLTAFLTNLVLGQFNPGFNNQPVAHTNILWNFGAMVLVGLAFTLGGGCAGRQLFLAGEGDGDAAVFFMGILVGAAIAHNFNVASCPLGLGLYAPAAVVVGLGVCAIIGFSMKERL